MKIAIGCDPNAEEAKYAIMDYIEKNNLGEIKDFGSTDVIYANVAIAVARAVVRGECDRGILLCGTGIGMSIAANKVKGAYAALISDVAGSSEPLLLYFIQLPWESTPGHPSRLLSENFQSLCEMPGWTM